MNFELTGEQQMLGETLRRYLRERYDFETRRQRRAGMGLDRELWGDLAERLGVLAATLPEELGGLGGGHEETMLISEALGEHLVVEPYLDSVVLAAGILRRSDDERAGALLESIGSGNSVIAFAHDEPESRLDAGAIRTQAVRSGDGWRLDGRKPVVSWAPAADHVIVSALCEESVALFLVDAGAANLKTHAFKLIDDRPAADLIFDGIELPGSACVVGGNAATELIEQVRDEAIAALCAEAVGLMRRMHRDTVAYTRERSQFGQPLAEFQILRHRMVDMYLELEQAISATHLATLSLDGPAPARRRACSAAKATISRAVRFVSQNAVQLHGAMGMTDELPIGHFFRRAMAIELELGSADDHVRRYAQELRAAA